MEEQLERLWDLRIARTPHQQRLIDEIQRVAVLRETDPEAAERWFMSLSAEDQQFLREWFDEMWAACKPMLDNITVWAEEFVAAMTPHIKAAVNALVEAGLVEDIDSDSTTVLT